MNRMKDDGNSSLDERRTDRTDENSWDTVWSRTTVEGNAMEGMTEERWWGAKREKKEETKVYIYIYI